MAWKNRAVAAVVICCVTLWIRLSNVCMTDNPSFHWSCQSSVGLFAAFKHLTGLKITPAVSRGLHPTSSPLCRGWLSAAKLSGHWQALIYQDRPARVAAFSTAGLPFSQSIKILLLIKANLINAFSTCSITEPPLRSHTRGWKEPFPSESSHQESN